LCVWIPYLTSEVLKPVRLQEEGFIAVYVEAKPMAMITTFHDEKKEQSAANWRDCFGIAMKDKLI
jgi:hypothetical protein